MTAGQHYEFGRFRLDVGGRLLFRDEQRIPLTPKAVDVLIHLVDRRGTAVSRQELLLAVWSDAVVEEGTLNSHISLLRKTLGDEFIETIPKRGYRFVGTVEEKRVAERLLLAVLPFENLTGGKRYDSFSDGLTEEMITQLGRLNPQRLGVIARTSAMTYKSTDKTIERIGRELGVSHILEGSARRAGNRVRIAAQLIQVSDQTHVWAETYESTLDNILVLQSRVSRAVAEQIQIRLLAAQPAQKVVPEAYEAYVKGRHLWHHRTATDLYASIRCFEEATEKDPAYAAPHAGMALAYLSLMDSGFLPPLEATVKARAAANKALALDEHLAEAYISLAHAAMHEFDWDQAEENFGRGMDLNPSYAPAHSYYSNYLLMRGRYEEAMAEAEESRRLDPVSPRATTNESTILWHLRRYARSIEEAGKSLQFNPGEFRAYEDIGRSYEQLGQFEPAVDALQKAVALSNRASSLLASLGYTCALAGDTGETTKILKELQDRRRKSFVSAYDFALLFFALGDIDGTFVWLDRAFEERSPALPFINANPRFDSLRNDPRYDDLLRRIG